MKHQGHFEARHGDTLDDVRGYQEAVASHLKPFAAGKRVLDVGASEGYMGYLLHDITEDYRGIDINPRDPNVQLGTIHDLAGGCHLFDLIIYNHVLEHVDNPLAELRAACSLLAPLGCVFIAVPYATAPWAWEYESHLWMFRQENLTRIAELAGLSVATAQRVTFRRDCEELWLTLR